MIEIKRYPSGKFLEYMERDIWKRRSEQLEPENMLDGYLGFMWLIFGTCLRNKSVQWNINQYERNRLVTTTLNLVKKKRSRLAKGKDIEEQIEFYHSMLDMEAKRRGGVVIDIQNAH